MGKRGKHARSRRAAKAHPAASARHAGEGLPVPYGAPLQHVAALRGGNESTGGHPRRGAGRCRICTTLWQRCAPAGAGGSQRQLYGCISPGRWRCARIPLGRQTPAVCFVMRTSVFHGHASHSGNGRIITTPTGLAPVRPQAFPAALRTAAVFAARQGKPPPRKLQYFYRMLQKASRLRLIMEKGTSQDAFFAEGKERKKGRTAMKNGARLRYSFFPSFGRFSTMRSNGLFAPYRRAGVGAKQYAKKEPIFGKKKFHGIRRFHGNSGAIDGT